MTGDDGTIDGEGLVPDTAPLNVSQREGMLKRRAAEAQPMRLILIDNNTGFIIGDTASFLAGSGEWSEDVTGNDQDVEALSLLAARLLDESIGEYGRAYSLVDDAPRGTSTGYHIYRADESDSESLPLVSDGEDQETIDAVRTKCRHLGFVRWEAS